MRILIISLFFLLSSISLAVAQRTMVYTEPQYLFSNALDLFYKNKFSSAQKEFEKYLRHNPKNSLNYSDAQYYVAICASELFNNNAEELLNKFITNYPESPKITQAFYNLGVYLYRKKRYKESIEWLEKSNTHEFSEELLRDYYFKLGYAYFEEKNFEKAKINLFEVKDIDNKYASAAKYYYSHICYLEKNYETALTGFQQLKDNEQFSHIVPYYIAQLYYLQEKYTELIAYAPPLLDSANTKRAPEIAKILGEAHYRTNNFIEALRYYAVYKEKGGIYNREDYYEMGFANSKVSNYSKAVENYQSALGVNDSLSQIIYYAMGECYIKNNEKAFARNAFQKAYQSNFDLDLKEDALFNYAKLSYELDYNPYNEAIISLNEYLSKYPNNKRAEEVNTFLVNVYLTTKNYKSALESIEKLKVLSTDLEYAYQRICYNRAVELFNSNELNDAKSTFNKGLKYMKEKNLSALSKYWLGEIHYKQNDFGTAISYFNEFIYEPGAALTPYFNTVNYNLGYSYFSQKQYSAAITWFRKFSSKKEEPDTKKLTDAHLRTADGYFLTKQYNLASDYYNEAFKLKEFDGDYALFQKSMADGLMGKMEQKEMGLSQLITNYTNSAYLADAYYEMAQAQLDLKKNSEAVSNLDILLTQFPNSSYIKKALNKKGLIFKNLNRDEEAVNTFKTVVANYPGTNESKDALYQIKMILMEDSKIEDWENYAKSIPFANISISELDSATYDIAKTKFESNDCDGATREFNNYLTKYPNGIFAVQANYSKSDCDYKAAKYKEALNGYDFVIKQSRNKYTETSLAKASYISYHKIQDYTLALAYYSQLEKIAEFKDNLMDAQIGIMRSAYKLNQYDRSKDAANKILLSEKISAEMSVESKFILANSLLNLKDTTLALAEFIALSNATTTETGAISKYNVAEIYYNKKDTANAEKACYEIINQDPSFDFWVAKSFILLSDIFVLKNDRFQAKHTLQSIIDNFEGAELIRISKEKLDKIIQDEKELEQKKVKQELELEINQSKPIDEKLFEEEKPQEGGNNNE